MHRIGDIHAHAAVQVMTDLHGRCGLRRQPVAQHVQVLVGVPPSDNRHTADIAAKSNVLEAMYTSAS